MDAPPDLRTLLRMGDGDASAHEEAERLWQERERTLCRMGRLLPGLERLDTTGPTLGEALTLRSHNALLRSDIPSWAELALTSTSDLARLRSIGKRSFLEIVGRAICLWAELDHPPAAPVALATDLSHLLPQPAAPRAEEGPPPELAEVAAWLWEEHGCATIGEGLELLAEADPGRDPGGAVARLLRVPLTALMTTAGAAPDPWEVLLELDGRKAEILRLRTYAERPLTLQAVAERFGITRERVRQLEVALLHMLDARWAEAPHCAPLRHAASRVDRTIGAVCTERECEDRLRDAVGPAPSEDERRLRANVLRSRIRPRVTIGALSIREDVAARLDGERRRIAALPADTLLDPRWHRDLVDPLQLPPGAAAAIDRHLGIRLVAGSFIPWRTSLNDRAVAVLAARGEPMTLDEIRANLDPGTNRRSLANAVGVDPRVMRRTREHHALRSWGGEEYDGILVEITQALRRAGGAVPLEGLVREIAGRFRVSPSSVRAYAGHHRFIRDGRGHLRLRTEEDAPARQRVRPPGEVGGLFRVGGIWHLRCPVDGDALRGSGRLIGATPATAAGLAIGGERSIEFIGGSVRLSWTSNQPAIGSIRPLVIDRGCVEGDALLLPLSGAEPRPVIAAPGAGGTRATGIARALAEIGLDPAGGPALLAEAIGLPASAGREAVAARLRRRGEGHWADLVALT